MPEPVILPYKDALDLAIFAINTLLYPDASSDEDMDRLDEQAENVIATLDDIRITLKELTRGA
jgi:hypothetical protein